MSGDNEAFEAFCEYISERFHVKNTQANIAKILGKHQPQLNGWKKSPPSRKMWKRLFERLVDSACAENASPLCEFAAIAPARNGGSWRVTADKDEEARLRGALDGYTGVYAFYDSSGRVIYIGKSASNLWPEIKQRLNAKVNRPVHRPTKVKHPVMGDMASYLSAYWCEGAMSIHNLEVLLLRLVPNDCSNKNIGHFQYVPR